MRTDQAKFKSDEGLFVFVFELWGTTVRVAAKNADRARWLLAHYHHFAGHWLVSPSVKMENHGWDDGPDAEARRNGDQSRIFNVVSAPYVEKPPPPETALLSGEADDRSAESDRD
ncbi:MAG: hypothetical protein HYZ07_00025 [Candidatus Harrisonbacteria bacterium]|nr:hypothetical protein [Candidatus Harrisonbacteria bacterium]